MTIEQFSARTRRIRGGLSALAIAVLVFGSASCFESDSIECETGIVCPNGSRCATSQAVCIFDECGDGEIDTGEECDNGDITVGDGCNARCQLENCGNGVVDPETPEICDDGGQCSDGTTCTDNAGCLGIGDGTCLGADTGICAADCLSLNECGNGVLNAGEECDDGNDDDGDGCDANCTETTCGNGVTTGDEACDDGGKCADGTTNCESDTACVGIGDGSCTPESGDACDADCTLPGCGNGVSAGAEVCDDGRHCEDNEPCATALDCIGVGDQQCVPRNRDGCSSDCSSDESCGNAIQDDEVGEVCDDGKHCEDGEPCTVDTECAGVGDTLCTPRAGDGCNKTCSSTETCGNTIKDDAVNEVCDDGKHCTNGNVCDQNSDCAGIGDNQCQTRSGDGCSADCSSDESCGNGDVDSGENCDDGQHCDDPAGVGLPGTSCTAHTDCVGVGVGDELCLARDGDGCSADCSSSEGCGNGNLDVGEQCDDQNGDNLDDCVACEINVCGDGFVDLQGPDTEDCDSGTGNVATCNADCTVAVCGDGFVNPTATAVAGPTGEQCDNLRTCADGGACSIDDDCTAGDGLCRARNSINCDQDCTIAFCGDNLTNSAANEDCDDGGESATCNYDCTTAACHDGVLNLTSLEQCDDGDTDDTDACVDTCMFARCGDGHTRAGIEDCDGAGETAACNLDCTTSTCHDGTINFTDGEFCDDGDTDNTDACVDNCVIASCGDGHTFAGVEDCDDAGESVDCNFNCTTSACHDGVLNLTDGEFCDDGDTDNTDVCVDNCAIASCGDGHVWSGVEDCDDSGESVDCNIDCSTSACHDGKVNFTDGEFCDDGDTDNTDACVDNCVIASCGDGHVWSGVEDCDDSGESSTCNINCSSSACHDGIVNFSDGEFCDDGDTDNTDACVGDCVIASCGDGHVWSGVEDCDDSGESVNCNIDCSTSACHDGKVNFTDGEFCDDGDTDNTDACVDSCAIASCGDGHVWSGVEDCDDGDPDNTDDCLTNCQIASCGDGFTNSNAALPADVETCDDGNVATETECDYGTQNCTTCSDDCTTALNLSGRYCGDNNTDLGDGETCDDGNSIDETDCDYGTATCTGCSSSCTIIASLTGNVCGDGVQDGINEGCDDGNVDACGTCSADCQTANGLSAATGSMGAIAPGDIADTETVTLDDGFNTAVVFEFDDANVSDGVTASNIEVEIGAANNANDVRDALIAAINAQQALGNLDITAAVGGGSGNLDLTHDTQSALGNQLIVETVTNASFAVSGMSGGSGADCSVEVGCASANDCSSGLCRLDNLCGCQADGDCGGGETCNLGTNACEVI